MKMENEKYICDECNEKFSEEKSKWFHSMIKCCPKCGSQIFTELDKLEREINGENKNGN